MRRQETLSRRPKDATVYRIDPVRFREILQRLGPTFIKLGQFLALRPDLIPQPYCDELLKLVDAVEPFPFSVARRIITEDLGTPPEQRFAWINPRPIAAASLAQVHQARTFDGEIVAVKVQRENVGERVRKDLRRARLLTRIFDLSGLVEGFSVPDVLREMSRWLKDELDMELELRNLARMYQLSSDVSTMRVPRPYPELSGRRVLTAELLEGDPFSELLRMVRSGQSGTIKSLGLEIDNLARNLIHTILLQIFRFQFFHADTHPGNLIAMPGDVVGFVDFGLTETLDATYRPGILRFVSAVYSNDVEGMLHGLTEVLTRGEDANLEGFRADFVAETRTWLRERDRPSLAGEGSSGRSPTGQYMVSVLRAARRNNMQIPAGVLSMYRSLLTAETVASLLGANVDLRNVGRNFFFQYQVENALKLLEPDALQPVAVQLIDLMRNGPGQVQRLLSDLADDRFVLHVRTSDTVKTRQQANTRARLIAMAVLSVGVAFLLSGAGQMMIRGIPLSTLLLVVLALIYVWIILLWRRLS